MRGSVFKKGVGWAYRVDIGRDPVTKKRQQQMRAGFRLKSEAEAALREVLQRVDARQAAPVSKKPLGEYLAEWLASLGTTVKASTAEGYEKAIKRVSAKIGDVRLCDLRPLHLRTLYTDLDVKHGLATKTIKNTHAVIHQALAQATADGLVQRNVADEVRPGGSSKVKPATNVWDKDDLKRFTEGARTHKFYAIYLFLVLTALRRGEALGLRWSDIDMRAGTLTVEQTITEVRGEKHIDSPKTVRSQRTISIGPRAIELLRYLEAQREVWIAKHGDVFDTTANLVFCDELGLAINPRKVSARFKPLCNRVGVRPIRVHDLRHTWATLAMRSGRNAKEVSAHLGHSTVQITLDLYVHVDSATEAATVARVEQAMFG